MDEIIDQLVRITDFMERKNWKNGATLMREWFAGKANNMPENGTPDTTTIKMDSVLSFHRAKEVYDSMIRDMV